MVLYDIISRYTNGFKGSEFLKKFVSWNVNGLRAVMKKGFMDIFNEFNADAFCLQEIKLQEGQIQIELDGYYQYWNYAEKKGYSGTAIFTKDKPLEVNIGLNIPEFDTEGRVITLEYPDYYLITLYTPNAKEDLSRLSFRMEWEDAFREYILSLEKNKPVIYCGDLNVAHKEIDLKNPVPNRGKAGFTDEEREKFQIMIDRGMIDTFRHFSPDVANAYSWWTYRFNARANNAGWRIDYFMTSQGLKSRLVNASIHPEIFGSDHCPVSLEIE